MCVCPARGSAVCGVCVCGPFVALRAQLSFRQWRRMDRHSDGLVKARANDTESVGAREPRSAHPRATAQDRVGSPGWCPFPLPTRSPSPALPPWPWGLLKVAWAEIMLASTTRHSAFLSCFRRPRFSPVCDTVARDETQNPLRRRHSPSTGVTVPFVRPASAPLSLLPILLC